MQGFSQKKLMPQLVNFSNKHKIINFVLSPDGKNAFFTAKNNTTYHLFEADIDKNGAFCSVNKINTVNSLDSTGLIIKGISTCYNANKLFFAAQYPLLHPDFDIYITEKKNGEWNLPVRLPDSINSQENEIDPTVSTAGDELFFSRETIKNKNEKPCYVILYSKKKEDNVWQTAKKLPYPINANCAQQAYLCSDNTTLLFLKSLQNSGETKIYHSQRIIPKIWTSPTEIEVSVDSSVAIANPLFAVFDSCLYFNWIKQDTSGIKHKQAKIKPVNSITKKGIITEGTTINGKNQKPINCNIEVRNAITNELIYKTNSEKGKYFLTFYSGMDYRVKFSKKNHTTVEYNISTENLNQNGIEYKTTKLFATVELELEIFDNTLFVPVKADIKIEANSLSDASSLVKTNTLSKGNYMAELSVGYNYRITVKHPNYEPVSFKFPLDSIVLFKQYSKTIFLEQVLVRHEIRILDKKNSEAIQAAISVFNSTKKTTRNFSAENAVNGIHSVTLREGDTYKISIKNQKGYFDQDVMLKPIRDKTNTTEIRLRPLEINSDLLLQHVTFEENAVNITEESKPELQQIVALLRNNPTIQIKARVYYVNENTSTEYDQRLSGFRAKELKKYFLKHKIKKTRIATEGLAQQFRGENSLVVITITNI